MWVICSDLEGVLVPEIWINVAKKTGIEKLKKTTRDIQDYDELMTYRLKILEENNLTLFDIQNVISEISPLQGALNFTDWARSVCRFTIVSDTFVEFAKPLMEQLNNPFLLCHNLKVDKCGKIEDYCLRQPDSKRKTVEAFRSLKYKVIAFGDSYNDISMLKSADVGILFCPPKNVVADYPEFPVVYTLDELKEELSKYIL